MRFFLVRHTRTYKPAEEREIELKKYVLCGWLLLVMNLALSAIITFVVLGDKEFKYHMITTIALAAYTFFTFTFAIINIVRYKKYNSPVYSAAKMISLIAASVSMLTLETAMLTAFGGAETEGFSNWMLPLTGAAVMIFAITMSIYVIVSGHKKLKKITPNN